MKNRGTIILGLMGVLVGPACAFAYSGTQTEQDACTSDVFSLCSAYIPNEDSIVACLQSKRAELSPDCANVMFPPTLAKKRHQRSSGELLRSLVRHDERRVLPSGDVRG